MSGATKKLSHNLKDLGIIIGMLGILAVLFSPIPPYLLDFLLITNFSFAILILLITFYSEKPLSFSTFPSLLLIATLFRLAMNIASTRLVLADAHAGKVIDAVGAYVVGGNYVIGMVVFLILVVVQFVVVTNGAQRVAEVAARFTLDSMPGKQMSIDADLNMGIIDDKEASKRRSKVEKEASFYGAMDGATKFVKGDAIAGIIIILINIIGGLAIGMLQHGMTWGEALRVFTLLTVGDGIVTQIPSLIISVATGIIITRASTDSHLGDELVKQITAHPITLAVVAGALLIAVLMPGLPVIPLLLLFSAFGAMYFYSRKIAANEADAESESNVSENALSESGLDNDLYDVLIIHPIQVSLGQNAATALAQEKASLLQQLQVARKEYAKDFGFVIPEVKFVDDHSLPENTYYLLFNDICVGAGALYANRLLAINPSNAEIELDGIKTAEPVYNLPAVWIQPSQEALARNAGYTVIDQVTLLVTHFSDAMRKHSFQLLSREETERLVQRVKASGTGLVDELIPNILSLSDVQGVLQELLREKVSIRRLSLIMEALTDIARDKKDRHILVEKVRQRLGHEVVKRYIDSDGMLNVITLSPAIERTLMQSVKDVEQSPALIVDTSILDALIRGLSSCAEKMMAKSKLPVIVCSSPLRRPLKQFVDRILPNIVVISMSEIPENTDMRAIESIKI